MANNVDKEDVAEITEEPVAEITKLKSANPEPVASVEISRNLVSWPKMIYTNIKCEVYI